MVQLENGTWMNYNPLPLLKYNNIAPPLQKCVRLYEWFVYEDTSCTNYSRTFLNVD